MKSPSVASGKKSITIQVDSEVANLYRNNPKKFEFILHFMTQKSSFLDKNGNWDIQKLNEVSDEAQKKGLTPEILEEILNEK